MRWERHCLCEIHAYFSQWSRHIHLTVDPQTAEPQCSFQNPGNTDCQDDVAGISLMRFLGRYTSDNNMCSVSTLISFWTTINKGRWAISLESPDHIAPRILRSCGRCAFFHYTMKENGQIIFQGLWQHSHYVKILCQHILMLNSEFSTCFKVNLKLTYPPKRDLADCLALFLRW